MPACSSLFSRLWGWGSVLLTLNLVSCISPAASVSTRLISPTEAQAFPFGSLVHFEAESPSADLILWSLDDGVFLSRGVAFDRVVSSGAHVVHLDIDGQRQADVSFSVDAPIFNPGSTVSYVMVQNPQVMALSSGRYQAAIVNCSPVPIGVSVDAGATMARLVQVPIERLTDQPIRLAAGYRWVPTASRQLAPDLTAPTVGDTHQFRVPDLSGSQAPQTITARCEIVEPQFIVWMDASTTVSSTDLMTLQQAAARILPRDRQLFGAWGDAGGSSVIHILLTPILNQGAVAVGFFNPADVLPRNSNFQSTAYNPDSNECNLLTMGVPESLGGNASFSLPSIEATIAHELSHLIRFERKTRQALMANFDTAPQEEVFLDEGLAHLAETLCGFGVSGGNVLFARRYLVTPEVYSFSGTSTLGQEDSVGRRGAMVLLLSALFWRAGGCHSAPEGGLLDDGGIAFLHSLVDSPLVGWEALQEATGSSSGSLLALWAQQTVAAQPWANYPVDPETGEPWGIDANQGRFDLADGSTVTLAGLTALDATRNSTVAPLGLALEPPQVLDSWPTFQLAGTPKSVQAALGSVVVQWSMLTPSTH